MSFRWKLFVFPNPNSSKPYQISKHQLGGLSNPLQPRSEKQHTINTFGKHDIIKPKYNMHFIKNNIYKMNNIVLHLNIHWLLYSFYKYEFICNKIYILFFFSQFYFFFSFINILILRDLKHIVLAFYSTNIYIYLPNLNLLVIKKGLCSLLK